tara:strand:+ start:283 stop:873 length:591 start_codon:yes stop_codon:yes gene_type:complete
MKFPQHLSITIANHFNGRAYKLIPATEVSSETESLRRIASICNEPAVYEWLFRSRLEGRVYEEEKAREWLRVSRDEWFSGTHFVFAVIDEQNLVAAACDIKSPGPVAEIGYWSSEQHRGVMTNAVKALCALASAAGYQALFARTKDGNVRSEAVLRRAGFEKKPSQEVGYQRFEYLISRETGPNQTLHLAAESRGG